MSEIDDVINDADFHIPESEMMRDAIRIIVSAVRKEQKEKTR